MKWRVSVDRADTRTVRLRLTARGREVTDPAIATVAELLDRLLAPLGGRTGGRAGDHTAALARELTVLLDTPLDP